MRPRLRWRFPAFVTVIVLTATTSGLAENDQPSKHFKLPAGSRVLYVEPEVRLMATWADDMELRMPEWEATARGLLYDSLSEHFVAAGSVLVPAPIEPPQSDQLRQFVLMNEFLARSVKRYAREDGHLPTKTTPRDWPLGPQFLAALPKVDADYALISTLAGAYVSTSTEVAAAALTVGVALLSPVDGALLLAAGLTPDRLLSLTLVELETGCVVWAYDEAPGLDERTPSGMAAVVRRVLAGHKRMPVFLDGFRPPAKGKPGHRR